MISLVTLALLLAVPPIIYWFLTWHFDYWLKRGVKFSKPLPLLGSFPNSFVQRQHFADDMNEIYKQYRSTERLVGVFLMRQPQLLILDPDLAREVFVSAFKHFEDNHMAKVIDRRKDLLLANNPFMLAGAEWKKQRTLLTPGLSWSRIKAVYPVVQAVCHSFCQHIDEQLKSAPKHGINGKEIALRFTAEIVADCVLGIKANSFSDHPVPMADNVKLLSASNVVFKLYSVVTGLFPRLSKLYKAKVLPRHSEEFFFVLMKQAYSMRIASKMKRLDFMNHLLAVRTTERLSDNELASLTMIFLLDGLDTSAVAISHCLLLLARNQRAQQKLFEEISEHVDANGELSFEKLNVLPYLDACFHESLRIFPPAVLATRVCTEPYQFTKKDGSKLQVNTNDVIMLPIFSFHHDPSFYECPEEFRPERFLPEYGGVRKFRDLGVFIGFGSGPRTCLGMRFARVQAKAAISAVVKNFKVNVNRKTKPTNRLDPTAILAMQDGGIWLDFERRH